MTLTVHTNGVCVGDDMLNVMFIFGCLEYLSAVVPVGHAGGGHHVKVLGVFKCCGKSATQGLTSRQGAGSI